MRSITPVRQSGATFVWWLVGLVGLAGLAIAVWVWAMFGWSYSNGERAGWVQKLSKKGYLCKTWEGEMAMVSLPGSMPEKFFFTVWDEETAAKINAAMGRRVSLYYEEHILLPTSCFGETRSFVKSIKIIEGGGAPLSIPGETQIPDPDAPAPLPALGAPAQSQQQQ